jgi:redox-sensitive bicupin YhaK (pirin superfamily)
MITLRKSGERRHERRREQEAWLTFSARDREDPLANGFGSLQMLNEDHLPPGTGLSHRQLDAETVTYVREGTLAYEDSMGRSGMIRAGEFRRMTTGQGLRHTETNASRTDWAHVFQIWVRPLEPGLESSHDQKRFSAAERRGVLCVVASPDGRRGSLRIHQDTVVYSAMVDPGQHIIHELSAGRSAWLHVVQGEATLGDVVLTTGDGAGFTAERAVSCTARGSTELLLLDLGTPPGISAAPGLNAEERHRPRRIKFRSGVAAGARALAR